MTRVAVSILNYNSSRSTVSCVQSLLNATNKAGGLYFLDIFIADNSSSADEQHQLQHSLAELPHVHLHVNPRNQGFAAGHNGNLQTIFLRSNPDFIWILNNDCLVYEETLISLIECSQHRPDVGIWGATLLESDGATIQCAGGCFYNSWFSSYRQYGQGETLAQLDQLNPVVFDYIAGASMFIPANMLRTGLLPIGKPPFDDHSDRQQWLNEGFFLYYEELDLARRLKPGIAMGWCKGALIKHAGGQSIGTTADRRTSQAEYHSSLSALKYTRLYCPGRMWFMAPARYLAKCLQFLWRRELALVRPLTQAYRDFWSV